MAQDAQERTEEATPKRRLDARRKGTVARSADLTGAVVLLVLSFVLPAAISMAGLGLIEGVRAGFSQIPTSLDSHTIMRFVSASSVPCLSALAIISGTALVMGLFVNFAQVGFVVSAESMNPTFEKIDPVQGFKRLLSARSFVEGIKTLTKGLLFGGIAYHAIASNWGRLIGMGSLQTGGGIAVLGEVLHTVLVRVAVAWLALAVLDYLFQRKQTDKQLRMSRDELKQEMKEQEGSPELKSEQAQRRRKLSRGKLSDRVREADAVVVNPTHYAVAIQYDRSKMAAPVVVATGVDYLALRIRALATEHRVPIIPNPALARALHKKCDVGDSVPRELFQAVAELLAYVYRGIGAR